MIGKAGSRERREHIVGQNEVAGIAEIIWDVALLKLRIGEVVAVYVTVCSVAADEVELVHRAAVDREMRTHPVMSNVAGCVVGFVKKRNDLASRNFAGSCAVGSRKSAEVTVEAAILFNDEDDMLDESQAGRRRRSVCRLGTQKRAAENRNQNAERENQSDGCYAHVGFLLIHGSALGTRRKAQTTDSLHREQVAGGGKISNRNRR